MNTIRVIFLEATFTQGVLIHDITAKSQKSRLSDCTMEFLGSWVTRADIDLCYGDWLQIAPLIGPVPISLVTVKAEETVIKSQRCFGASGKEALVLMLTTREDYARMETDNLTRDELWKQDDEIEPGHPSAYYMRRPKKQTEVDDEVQ